jgi:hypothetical protein
VDSSRSRDGSAGFDGLNTYLDTVADSYSRNYWLDQPKHLEVFTEKDAMSTILHPIIRKWNVPFTVFRGNPSDTMCYQIGQLINIRRLEEPDEGSPGTRDRRFPGPPRSVFLGVVTRVEGQTAKGWKGSSTHPPRRGQLAGVNSNSNWGTGTEWAR